MQRNSIHNPARTENVRPQNPLTCAGFLRPEDVPETISTEQLTRFILKLTAGTTYGLFVVVDGLNNPESFETRLLTLPYFVGGLALVRSIGEALDHHYNFHAGLFALGLSTLGALA